MLLTLLLAGIPHIHGSPWIAYLSLASLALPTIGLLVWAFWWMLRERADRKWRLGWLLLACGWLYPVAWYRLFALLGELLN